MNNITRAGLVGLVAVVSSFPQSSGARPIKGVRTSSNTATQASHGGVSPYARVTNRDHMVGNIRFRIANTGYFGGDLNECRYQQLPAAEFPIRSGFNFLFGGGLWIGAIRNGDTLVSQSASELAVETTEFVPLEQIVERTTRSELSRGENSRCEDISYSPDAISEQDIVVVYSDTLTRQQHIRPGDFSAHQPLGIEVTQESYAWSADYAGNFILVDYQIRNVSGDTLKEMYVGILMDQDVFGPSEYGFGYEDDIASFIRTVPSHVGSGSDDTLNLAWMADNDGDPSANVFSSQLSNRGVFGVRIVDAPAQTQVAFNWWVSSSSATRDWGPSRVDSPIHWVMGNLGTPNRDVERYGMMANGETDYPQWEAAIDHTAEGWLPPVANPALAIDLSNGFDSKYLLSVGPVDLLPDSTLPLVIAFVAGEDLHTNPRNFANYFDAGDPRPWLNNLNFDNFTRNAQWAGWVYDNPGVDTDGDGYRGNYQIFEGDTVYYTGDGVPDFRGPPPPTPPSPITQSTSGGNTKICWNGYLSETGRDPFTLERDFEGYRIYLNRGTNAEDFAIMTSRDVIDFIQMKYRSGDGQWRPYGNPLTLDSLKKLYDALSLSQRGYEFHPDSFIVDQTSEALAVFVQDEMDPARLDTNFFYFEPFGRNHSVDDSSLAYLVDSLHQEVVGVIRKVYPFSDPGDSVMFHADGLVTQWPYYEYEYVFHRLYISEPVLVSVTTFDFGQPSAHIASRESLPQDNVTEVWSHTSSEFVRSKRPEPGVFPNPYRMADGYRAVGYEDPHGIELNPERTRRVTFTNVPDTCTISVYSLDGDLVRRLSHAEAPGSARATVAEWNLLTRNTQRVTTGIYIYAVESRFGTDIGKLVIIK